MFSPYRNTFAYSSFTAVLVFSLWIAAPALAQPPPQRDACDQVDPGERIQCRFQNLIAQQRVTAQMVDSLPTIPASQKQSIMSQVERANRAEGRANSADFMQLTKRNNPSCQIVEIEGDNMGNDDGVCKGNEDCVEVIGDQIGNDDGICRPRNGAKREVCLEICDEEAVRMDPDNFDDDLGLDVEEQLDQLTDQYEELNQMLSSEQSLRAAARVLSVAGDDCTAVILSRRSTNLLAGLSGAATGLRIGADVAERFCDQSVFGANTSAVCAVIEGVAGAAMLVSSAFSFEDGVIDSDTIDASYACLQDVSSDVAVVAQGVGDTNTAIAAMQLQLNGIQSQVTSIEQQLDDVERLVNTPLGLREGFPTTE